jgi:3'-phosphoadenosine 5'-phosphosulfate sulfotransferase (PAPS reductase)/FAD synthetase
MPEEHVEGLRALLKDGGTVILNVSGGRDSAVAASVATETVRSLDPSARIYMLYAHTPLALEENLEYVKRLAEWLNVPLLVAKPNEGLETIVRRGLPSPLRRWCMYKWKIEPMYAIAKRFPPPRIDVVGVRLSESTRRLKLFEIYAGKQLWYYCNKYRNYCSYYYAPILDWSREDVLRYIEERGVPKNPLWNDNGHSSHDCVICIAYAGFSDWIMFKQRHPELWEKIYALYREMNEKRRRERKVLAWNYVDLDDVAKTPSLLEFTRLQAIKKS